MYEYKQTLVLRKGYESLPTTYYACFRIAFVLN